MNKEPITEEVLEEIVSLMVSEEDPEGSYTGVPLEKNAIPTQDADDL